jgi:hypothetical protein
VILYSEIDLGTYTDCDLCGKQPNRIEYEYDVESGKHLATVYYGCHYHDSAATETPGEIYNLLAPFRDNPQVLTLLNWLV